MTDDERRLASKAQIKYYAASIYPKWHVVAVKSIRKILHRIDEFYEDLLPDLEDTGSNEDIVNRQIRNGWFFEAVAHAEQAIEDLFSTIMNLKDLSYFTKDVLYYGPGEAKRYIWNFDSDNLEYLADQFGFEFCPLDDKTWERKDVFEKYKEAILLTQKYVGELKKFHRKYYEDYCQYKHGLSVGLIPVGMPLQKNDDNRHPNNPMENGLFTFHNGSLEKYKERQGHLPAIILPYTPDVLRHSRELLDDGNLLFSTVHSVNMDEIVEVTEHACILLNVVWHNITKRLEENDTDKYFEIAYPMSTLKQYFVIGYPRKE